MNTQRAAVALRQIIVGALTSPHGDSLQGINTHPLPDGAEAYVTATRATYRLNKSLTPSVTDLSPALINPSAGPGVWVLQGSSATSWSGAEIFGNEDFSAATAVPVLNTWRALPSGSALYEASAAGSPAWELDPDTGILTYSGAPAVYEITASAACYSVGEGSGLSDLIDLTVSQNGDWIGATTDDFQSTQTQTGTGEAEVQILSLTRVVGVEPADTIQHVFRNLTGTSSVGFTRYTVAITEI